MSSGFHQVLIGGYPSGGLTQDRKPALLANEAYSDIENAYVFRERTKKRDGEVPMGRLSRVFTNVDIGNSSASPWTFNLYTKLSITKETNAQIKPGSVSITIATIATPFVDAGNGTLTNVTSPGSNHGTINYLTGDVTITDTAGAGHDTHVTMTYFPMLPVMGILKRDVATFGIDATVFFDTKYAYQFVSGFQELASGTTWSGTNTDFFWAANYQGATPNLRYFFETNNNITSGSATPYDPIRYYNNSTWNDLQPQLDAVPNFLYQALIVIPYYGRLLALNTWEGPKTAGNFDPSVAVNYFARCRFSQIGSYDIGRYEYVLNPSLRKEKVPCCLSPWIIVNTRNKRKSGRKAAIRACSSIPSSEIGKALPVVIICIKGTRSIKPTQFPFSACCRLINSRIKLAIEGICLLTHVRIEGIDILKL